MANVFDHTTPAPQLTEDILRKVNALGHEPRVVIELDKMSYVPGLKSRFEVWDRIYEATWDTVSTESVVSPPLGDEPSTVVAGGESGDRFEFIKCAMWGQVQAYSLPNEAYYFLLAVAKHETGFGTLGQGRPEKGSFIVGYGCPGSCDFTYSGIETQCKFAAKRFYEAMKSRLSKLETSGTKGMTADDIDYFHQGGDKGYNRWVWSADGANWKTRVKQYYDTIRAQAMQLVSPNKWHCKGSAGVSPLNQTQSAVPQNISGSTAPRFPVEGISFSGRAKYSSPYGNRNGSLHNGVDISHLDGGSAKINGMWVVAAWGGTVSRAEYSSSYGNVVYVKHTNGYETVYAHMQHGSIQVRSGQVIQAGQRLGKVGNTGDSYGAHLHFEIWRGGRNGGTSVDPYPVLTGAQSLGIVDSVSKEVPKMEVIPNVKFDKCFTKDAQLDDNWTDKANAKHFTSVKTGEKYLGFSGNVPKGGYSNFGYKHNFSADGYYEYSFFADLKGEDAVVVSIDGHVFKRYTKADNTAHTNYETPVYIQYLGSDLAGINSHILDFTIENISGESVFGLKCLKVTEVDVLNGVSMVNSQLTPRKRDMWMETGAFAYDTTFTLEDDILNWEVNTHYDMRVATARITLDNKLGVYSPTYERDTVFPDNLREAEMTYFEEDAIRHVLSEATPVRIYAGYGENLVRVFTGRIKGEIQQDSDQKTITLNCVDAYDILEEHVFDRFMTYPRRDEIHGDETQPLTMWVKSAIIHNIVNEAGLVGWRIHDDDLRYPDAIIEETYYIDIDRGGQRAVVWDAKTQKYVEKNIATVKDAYGFKNPYVQAVDFPEGTRAADAIQDLIGEIMYRSYCDRYGTFRLENTRNLNVSNDKWEFVDGENLISLTTSIDHSRVRNHLMVVGSGEQITHFVDKDLLISTKGLPRTAKIAASWIDESYGATARGIKEDVANKAFSDMKRQARTFNCVVKGNPMIDILDGVYVYDRNTSTAGYFIVKGNRLTGNQEGMVNSLELTWEDTETHKEVVHVPAPPKPAVENLIPCGKVVNSGDQKLGDSAAEFNHNVTDKGYVYIEWMMFVAKDRITVYVGGKRKFDSGMVSNGDGGPIAFYYKPDDGAIKVIINEGGVTHNTGWNYTLYCPGTAPKAVEDKARFV